MDPATAFRAALETGDIAALRGLWSAVAPHLPQPANDGEAEIAMHVARTQAESVSIRKRAYSHRWLEERSLPSSLPDHLKPQVDRLYPKVVGAVGISVNFRSEFMKPAKALVERAMGDAVEDAFAEGRTDLVFVSAQMARAKAREMKALFGGIHAPRG